MPTKKSKDDTWKESELLDAIQGSDRSKKKSSSSRSKEKESSGSSGHRSKGESKEKDRERRERKDRDGDKRREDADSRHRRDAEHRDRERKRDRDRDRDRDGEKDRDRESRRDKDSHREGEERRDKDSSRDNERERRKHREGESRDAKDTSEKRRTERDRAERDRAGRGRAEKDRPEKDRAEKDEDRRRRKDKRDDKHGERSEGKSREARHDEGRERDRDRTSDRKHERSGERRREKDGSSRDKLTEKIRDYDSGEGRRDSAERDRRKSKVSKSKEKDKSDRHRSRRKEDHDIDDWTEQRDSEKVNDNETRHRSEKSRSHKSRSKNGDDVIGTQKEASNRDENPKDSQETSRYKPEKKMSKQESYEEDIEEETTKRPSLTMRKESILNTEEVNEEVIATGDDYDYGDDDFEDYDDDFEDDEGDDDASGDKEDDELNLTNEELEGVNEIRKAIREENELAKSLNSSASSSRPSTRDGVRGSSATTAVKNQARGKINFIAAKQKQISDKVSSRTRRRGKELSKLIELDMVAMDLFELQPLNIYEVYMKSFGRTGTEQVAVQTNDDNLEQETQTDDIETETRWCQFSNEVQAFGGGDEKTQHTTPEKKSLMTQDTRRLNKFLGRAAQLCLTLLDEVNVKLQRTSNRYKDSRSTFSGSFARIDVKHKVTNGRNFVDAQLSPTQSNLLLVAYGKNKELKNSMSPDGLLCVWNINESDEPRKYLSCGSTPRCCCFSPTKPSFAFAGMDDGSVSVWDLREPSSMHSRKLIDGFEFILRSETFSTASVYGEETHISSVVSLVSIAPPEDSDSSNRDSRDTIDNSGRALQLASLEENGTVNIWVVIEVFSPDPGGSVQDLGLLPGGKVKLVKSGSISPQIPKRSLSLPRNYTATRLHVEPKDAQYFYIGTDQGEVLHCSRFGEKVIPKSFCTCDPDAPVMVSSIDHSPFRMPYVLVGCSDGSILLFDSNKEFPITTWQMFSRSAGIVAARWSHNKPSVFYVLDRHSFFYVWDLFKSSTGPVVKESMAKGEVRPTNFYLSNDPSGNQEVVFFNNDHSLEVHKLKKLLVDSSKDDIESLCMQIEELS